MLSLQSRLLLLVIASVLPLIGMGLFREYWNYRAQSHQVYEGLQTAQGNRVKKLPDDEAGEKVIIPTGSLAPAAQ